MEQSTSARPAKSRQERTLVSPPSSGATEVKLSSPGQAGAVAPPAPCSESVVSETSCAGVPTASASSSASANAGRIPTSLPLPPTPAPPRSVQPPPAATGKKRKRRRRRRPAAILRFYRTWTAAALLLAGGMMGVASLMLIAYLMGADPLGLASQNAGRPAGLDRRDDRRERVHPVPEPAEIPFGFTEGEEEIDDGGESSSLDTDEGDTVSGNVAVQPSGDVVPAEEDTAADEDNLSFRERLWQLRKRRGRFRPRP